MYVARMRPLRGRMPARSLQGSLHGGEGGVERCSETGDDGDNCDGDAGRYQAIFDRSCSRLILYEAFENRLHGVAPSTDAAQSICDAKSTNQLLRYI
jgi:hypothetical protein